MTDRYFVSSYWTFCPVIWLFGDVELWDFCWTCLRKVVVLVCWDCNSSVVECCPVRTSSTQGNCRIYPLNCAKKVDKKSNSVYFSQRNVLQIFNISQKIAKFDIESDFQKSSFSSNLDKNNWTRKIDLFHTLGISTCTDRCPPRSVSLRSNCRFFPAPAREVISGSELNAQKSEKLADFWANFWTPIWRILCQNYIQNSHFWVAGQQFIGHPVYPPSVDISWSWNCSLFHGEKIWKFEIFEWKNETHVPPQTTSFLAYFPHSSGFFPPWERPEFVKKSHFLDETTPAERTSIWKKRQ